MNMAFEQIFQVKSYLFFEKIFKLCGNFYSAIIFYYNSFILLK